MDANLFKMNTDDFIYTLIIIIKAKKKNSYIEFYKN